MDDKTTEAVNQRSGEQPTWPNPQVVDVKLAPTDLRIPLAAALTLALLTLVAGLLDIVRLLPLLSIIAVTAALHVLGALLLRRGWRPQRINPAIRVVNLSAYTLAVILYGGLYSPLIPLYVEDILSASLRDGRRGAWLGWGLVLIALSAVALASWPLTTAEIVRFLTYAVVMAIVAAIAGALGQQRIETHEELAKKTVENARLYAQLEERAARLHAAYEALKELDRQKTEFVESVSHDLGAPLSFIRGYVELLQDGGLGELNPLQREKLGVVIKKTDLLTDLVRDIVSLHQDESRLEEMGRVALAEVLRRTTESAEAAANERGLRLQIDLPDDPLTVRGQARRLEQVLDNLLSNAIKFSPDGGTITVGAARKEKTVVAWVADQGIGVPPEEQARIFERHYQVPGATRRAEGSGLGLAIVKEIVEGHGGQVWIKSPTLPGSEGRGSTFCFSMPCAKGDA